MDILDSFYKSFLEKKREWVIGTSSVVAGVALLIGYFQSGPTAVSYAQAEAAFAKWEIDPQNESLYRQMKEAIRKVPALGKKYEASIAQKLLNTEKLSEALELANRSIQRVKEEAPYHSLYAENSLIIEQGNYQQALENAVTLKEQLSQESPHSLLFAHNLLRIACLQQQLKNKPGEKVAWEELEAFLKQSPYSDLLLTTFSDKKIDLAQYIAERKKSL